MAEARPEVDYSLFQENIIIKLTERNWFIPCIAVNYEIVGRAWGCTTTISERRLGEAFDFWQEDQRRTLAEGIRIDQTKKDAPPSLDHFKHASFIAFWLRRMLPINHTNVARDLAGFDRSKNLVDCQQFFMRYGNELAAFLIGFQICLFYESSVGRDKEGKIISMYSDRMEYLKHCNILPNTVADFVMILKHKNMSPHALYLLYKALFTTISPD